MRRAGGWFGWVGLLLGMLFLVGCGPGPSYQKVSLQPEGAQPAVAGLEETRIPLRVAVAGVLSPETTFAPYGDLVAYLGEHLGRPAQMLQGKTYAEVNELVRTGQVDLAFVCTGAYVVGERDFGMRLLAVPQVRGETVYYSYIIVPADSPAQTLAALQGKVFAFTDPMSNSGHLAALEMLRQLGVSPGEFFRRTIFTYSHDRSIQAVAEGLVDGAAVDSLVYVHLLELEPAYREKVRVIERSPPYGMPPVVVHPRLDPELQEQLQVLLLGMDEDEAGRAILDQLDIDRFVPPDKHAYDSVRQMMEALGK